MACCSIRTNWNHLEILEVPLTNSSTLVRQFLSSEWNHLEINLLVSPWESNCEGRCEISFDSIRTQGKFIRENRLSFTFI